MRDHETLDRRGGRMSLLGAAAALLLAAAPARAGLLSAGGIFLKDLSGNTRSQFSDNERVNLSARVSNATASTGRIVFTFRIIGPSGAQVFLHTGNSVPGSVGNSASSVSGVPVSQFYTGPGVYTFQADAVLDAQTVSQSATFLVSSPNLILVYPPNGARDVADKPLTFRWVSSGASRYRVTVGDNIGFQNSVFSQTTTGGENFLAYPENPTDDRQRLAADQVYYWKVEGLNDAGNVISQSDLPFNFTAQTASLTRDLAVTDLQATGSDGATLSFTVRVANQGGTSESNVPLAFSLGGLPAAGSPVTLPLMAPGDSRTYPFSAPLPTDQGQSLAVACIQFFDDNVPNNCRSIQVQRPPDTTSGGSGFAAGPVSEEALWQELVQKLNAQGTDLSGYDITTISQQLSPDDLKALLDQL
ncbi:MAG: hypothetical protein KGL53_11010, partial [Elusimicrobia bacterium]|nr:hypothetical protein [Elusimicrobiota bacterium]